MKKVCLSDGGMGQELVSRTKALGNPIHPLWGAKVLLDQPGLVKNLHVEFLRAGAKVITVNSYSLTKARLEKYGLVEKMANLFEKAVHLANLARDEVFDPESGEEMPFIAGCLPPMASYRPEMAPTDPGALEMIYTEIAEMQADGVDLFICETMVSLHEASCAVRAAKQFGKPVWCSLTIRDDLSGQLRSGEPLSEVLPQIEALGCDAILINCSSPEAIGAAIPSLLTSKLPVGAYMNGFKSVQPFIDESSIETRTVEVLQAREDLNAKSFSDLSMKWVKQGLSIVGGCCEITPPMIELLKSTILENGYHIVAKP